MIPKRRTCISGFLVMYAWWWQSLKLCISKISPFQHTSECTLWTELAGTSPSFGNKTIWTHQAGKVPAQLKICKTPLQKQHLRAVIVTSFSFYLNFYKLYAMYTKTEAWSSGLTKAPHILLSPWYLHHFKIWHKDSRSLPNFGFFSASA